MKKHRCLYCYRELAESEKDFHTRCSRKFFGTPLPPELNYDKDQMQELARQIVIKSVAITGVQPKLSLEIEKIPGDPKKSRLTIVGLWGNFILKPPGEDYPNLPENEDLTMHLAEVFGIPTAGHSLIRLQSGELAYITRRFDRIGNTKLAQEDMCQLTETLTADKYKGSMEKIGRNIRRFSSRPGFDAIVFWETAIQSFITGNADMHLKNFSLLTSEQNEVALSPAYDLVASKLVLKDDEEMALTINAKRAKLKRKDFDLLADHLQIPEKSRLNSYEKFALLLPQAYECIDASFLPDEMKADYKKIMQGRTATLGLV